MMSTPVWARLDRAYWGGPGERQLRALADKNRAMRARHPHPGKCHGIGQPYVQYFYSTLSLTLEALSVHVSIDSVGQPLLQTRLQLRSTIYILSIR